MGGYGGGGDSGRRTGERVICSDVGRDMKPIGKSNLNEKTNKRKPRKTWKHNLQRFDDQRRPWKEYGVRDPYGGGYRRFVRRRRL